VPASAVRSAEESIGSALGVANQLGGAAGRQLVTSAQAAFFDGFHIGCLVASAVLFTGSIFAARFLPARPDITDQFDVDPLFEPIPA
jgi:hypothetical protein